VLVLRARRRRARPSPRAEPPAVAGRLGRGPGGLRCGSGRESVVFPCGGRPRFCAVRRTGAVGPA